MEQKRDKLVTELARLARQIVALCEAELSNELLTMSEEDAKELERRLKRHQCLQCDVIESEDAKFKRGLHEACYQASHRKVKAGEATWARLMAAGLALPRAPGGRPQSSGTRLDAFLESFADDSPPLTPKIEDATESAANLNKVLKEEPAKKGKGKK